MANNFLFVKIIGEMPEVLNELKNALDELMKREAVFSSGFRFSSLLSKKSRLEPTSGIVGCTRKKMLPSAHDWAVYCRKTGLPMSETN